MNGILNIDKPAGMTSHDVVARIRRLAHLKRVGHAGTLDPDATGVLLVCLGSATRLSDYLAAEGKSYQATLALGVTTSTEDASGEALTETDASGVTEADLRAVLPQFMGDILQVPPMVSAVHHQGRRLYELARQGVTVEREARSIHVEDIALQAFHAGPRATATLEVVCGKGTYIRTLCADIGAVLGVGGHMASLRRTRVGNFSVTEAVPLDKIIEVELPALLVSPSQALAFLPAHLVTEQETEAVAHGRALITELADAAVARIVDAEGHLLALARAQDGRLHPFKVFTAA